MADIFVAEKKEEEKDTQTSGKAHKDKNVLPQIEKEHAKKPGMLQAFCPNPLGVSFNIQDPDEVILLFLRRHFITNVPWIAATLLLVFLPLILAPALRFFEIRLFFFSSSLGLVLLIFYYLIVFAFAFISFLTWYFNISLVTNKRLVDVDFSGLVYHDFAVTSLNLVQDSNYAQVGFIRSFFNYGDVFVQTAGEKAHFDFHRVPQPRRIIDILDDLIGKKRHV